jgi:anhydro-N-acetylmuramic acid kinase
LVQAYEQFILPKVAIHEVVLCGGGIYNQTLMRMIRQQLDATDFCVRKQWVIAGSTPEQYGIPNKAKEALAFALLGWARLQGLPNNLPSCTGAKHYVSLGEVTE